jgi:cell fate (sporulation/competence/biofilm development) regulator YlbF (YheA/YmcA/DUF963 family)
MNNLDQKIQEFSQAIQETKECQAYKQAALAYGSDMEAQKLLDDFQMAQQELAILQDGGFSGQEEQKTQYESLLDEVRKNKVINEWFESRRQMEILIGDLATALSHDLGFPFSLPPKKSCGCGG